MSDEAAFTEHLAQHPGPSRPRGAYADWLDEHDRGEEASRQRRMGPGYRALVARGRLPRRFDDGWSGWANAGEITQTLLNRECRLPRDWFDALPRDEQSMPDFWSDWDTDEEAMDAAALAFADLPAARQAELLAVAPAEASA